MFVTNFNDWEQRKVKSISEKTYGGGTPKTKMTEYWQGDFPWIQSSDLKVGELNEVKPQKFITEEALKNSAAKAIPKNSIAIVTRVGVGKLAYLKYPYSTSQDFLSLSVLTVDPLFGVYGLYKLIKKELNNIQGTSIKGMTKSDLLNKKLYIPFTLEEQKQIGTFLKTLDNTIALHQEKLEKLKQLKKAYLQVMFPQKGEKTPQLRFANFSQDWEQGELKELASFSKGLGYTKSDLVEKGTSIILYGRLYTKYQIVIEDVDTYVTIKEKSVLSKGDEVIVPSSGESSEDIARASVVAKAGILIGGDLNIIKTDNSINPIFLALNISHGKQQQELRKRAQGKSVVHLHNSDLKKVNLIYPMLEEQIQIGRFFNQLDDNIAFQSDKVEKLKKLKEVYLSKMFT
ncbi:restriction endonuclease subunit S [Desemzia incerta]|uniref:restriction endonuclease subunit S n=1 Tax=Desemzia incerta TaxID=82801 RepID=UPI0016607C66|nr:restriction endonuclease subunit S [Desemzia incerta]